MARQPTPEQPRDHPAIRLQQGWPVTDRLARRPTEAAPADDVAMEVGNGFAGVGSVVEHEAEAGFSNAEAPGDFGSFEKQMSENLIIGGFGQGDAGNRFLWNNENMDRCLRFHVFEGDHEIVFKDNLGGDLPIHDLLK